MIDSAKRLPREAVEAGERGDVPGVARALAAAGVPVFPCRDRKETWTDRNGAKQERNAKSPLTGRGFKDASTDPETVRKWFGPDPAKPRRRVPGMYGVPTGPASGFWVLDVDRPKTPGEPDGMDSLAKIREACGELPETLTIETPSGGLHVCFALTPEAQSVLVNAAGAFGPELPGLDVRCSGGYVIGAYSFNADEGKAYVPQDPEAPLAEAPDFLLDLLRAAQAPDPAAAGESRPRREWTGPLPGGDAWAPFARKDFAEALRAIEESPERGRNKAFHTGAFHIVRLVMRGCIPESELPSIEAAFIAAGAVVGHGESECRSWFAGARKGAESKPWSAVELRLIERDREWRERSRERFRAPEEYADEEDGPLFVGTPSPASPDSGEAPEDGPAPESPAQDGASPVPSGETYRRPGPTPDIEGLEALKSAGPVALVLSVDDAEAFRAEGVPCVALRSVENVSRCMLAAAKAKRTAPLVYHEDAGDLCRWLTAAFGRNSLPSIMGPLHPEGKTPSVVHATEPGTLAECVKKLTVSWREAALELYRGTESAAAKLDDFLGGIAARAATTATPTGFAAFDSLLDGGLYEGLYVLGATSSNGKTALALQIADQAAARGADSLFFTLEMSASELMARSISRATRELADADGKALADLWRAFPDMDGERGAALERAVRDVKNAKTARKITTGALYEHYSPEELALIDSAVDLYGLHADRIFFVEGVGDFGVDAIRERVERHVQIAGTPPVVFVDYVQILAPYDVRATDKQNMDHAMRELRRLSRDFKAVVFCVSSFNRASYRGPVTMEAFKESGAIEYSSDVLLGLQFKGVASKDFDLDEAKRQSPRKLELVVLKNRTGRAGVSVDLDYFPAFNLFRES